MTFGFYALRIPEGHGRRSPASHTRESIAAGRIRLDRRRRHRPRRHLRGRRRARASVLAVAALIVAGLVVLVAAVLSARITRPLTRLVGFTESVARGNLDARVSIKTQRRDRGPRERVQPHDRRPEGDEPPAHPGREGRRVARDGPAGRPRDQESAHADHAVARSRSSARSPTATPSSTRSSRTRSRASSSSATRCGRSRRTSRATPPSRSRSSSASSSPSSSTRSSRSTRRTSARASGS